MIRSLLPRHRHAPGVAAAASVAALSRSGGAATAVATLPQCGVDPRLLYRGTSTTSVSPGYRSTEYRFELRNAGAGAIDGVRGSGVTLVAAGDDRLAHEETALFLTPSGATATPRLDVLKPGQITTLKLLCAGTPWNACLGAEVWVETAQDGDPLTAHTPDFF